MAHINDVISVLPIKLRSAISLENVYEIRLRAKQPVITIGKYGENIYENYIMTKEDIRQSLEYISNYSIYAYQDNIRQGYITIKGGHRIGVCGQVIEQNGHIKAQQYISFINIRIAHEIKGCADKVMNFINFEKFGHTLIISPPSCGKTTLLRDMIRQLSKGNEKRKGMRVSVIDERGEIASAYNGIPQNDLGMRTDVISGCNKSEGMLLMVRSMNPQVIAVDEIGMKDDIEAIEYIINCGCRVIATMHAQSLDEAIKKPYMKELINKDFFSNIIVLSSENGVGTIKEMIDLKQ